MFKTEILFGVVALSIGVVHSLCSYRDESPADSWDIVISSEGQLEFYSNQTKTNSEGTGFRDLSALAYDAVHNVLFFVDRANDNATIFSFNLTTKKFQSLVKNKWLQNIQGLAFDPVKRMLFWTDIIESSIFWMSLIENDGYGNVLIKMNDEIPVSIAVDSCREYIYWTCILITDSKSSIERSKFDGSEREVIVHTHLHMPLLLGLAIDQRTKRLYWADVKEGIPFSIESSNLEGEDRQILLNGAHRRPNTLTISKNWIYWVDPGHKTVWKLAKDKENVEPLEVLELTKSIFGVVANYGIPECETLPRTLRNKAARFDNSTNAWLALVLYFCILTLPLPVLFTVPCHFY